MAARTGRGPTPLRRVRVPDDLWTAATAAATARGTDVSTVMRDALTALVTEHFRPAPVEARKAPRSGP